MRGVTGVLFLVLLLCLVPVQLWAQQPSTEEVMKNLDEKAQAFTSLQASLTKQSVDLGVKLPAESGKIYIKMNRGVPRILLDITSPKELIKTALIDDGSGTVYWPGIKRYAKRAVAPDSDVLQYLLIGFGVRADRLLKGYAPAVKGQEALNGTRTVLLELTSTSDVTSKYPLITLWLNSSTWTPVQTRLTEKSKAYHDFLYSDVQLNRNVPDSRFRINIPKDALSQ